MGFYDRYVSLCHERNVKPTSQDMVNVTGVTSSGLSQWKTMKTLPSAEIIGKLTAFFGVSADYLIGISDIRLDLTPHEELLLKAFNAADADGQQEIITTCRIELRKAEQRLTMQDAQ